MLKVKQSECNHNGVKIYMIGNDNCCMIGSDNCCRQGFHMLCFVVACQVLGSRFLLDPA
jgi:hypothetical protein